MVSGIERIRFISLLSFLILSMLLLTGRLLYIVLADASRFPINTVKISASYQHISRHQLETVLYPHLLKGFFGLSVQALEQDLKKFPWTRLVHVKRLWPDALNITLVEKTPIAWWNDALITAEGETFSSKNQQNDVDDLPQLSGPASHAKDVLQIYKKLSNLLVMCGLGASAVHLRDNQSWELVLNNGILLQLGKKDLELRLNRFCRAYPAVFADRLEQLSHVDLRYARGMAVQWKQPMGR